jgi:hypothetical protein
MRKLLLVLFLFALSSNALAKVEIWECDNNNSGNFGAVYKIDTDIPLLYYRANGMWIDLYATTKGSSLKYNKEHDSILVYDLNGEVIATFDLILKKFIFFPYDAYAINYSCRVKE